MTGRAMNDDRGAGDPLPCKRMTCAACGYDTAEMYPGIDIHAPFRKITLTGAMEEGSVSYDNGPPMKTSRGLWLEIFVCPRCGTLKI